MTERTVPIAAQDGERTKRIARFKCSFEADVATIKSDLTQWLDEHVSNSTASTTALLETAFDRYLAERTTAVSDLSSAAADITDMVQAILRRAVQRQRAALYVRASRTSRAFATLINDEELANRLT
jgi:hypothetical protein